MAQPHHQALHRLQEPLRLPGQGPGLRAGARDRRAARLAALHARHPGLPRQRQGRCARHRPGGDAATRTSGGASSTATWTAAARPIGAASPSAARRRSSIHRSPTSACSTPSSTASFATTTTACSSASGSASSTSRAPTALAAVLTECGADAAGFPAFLEGEGRRQLARHPARGGGRGRIRRAELPARGRRPLLGPRAPAAHPRAAGLSGEHARKPQLTPR